MKDNCEDPIVKCFGCEKEFKNNPNAKMNVDNVKYYACSGECKGIVANKAKKLKKSEEAKNQVS